MDTLASELREVAAAIDRVAHEAACWSVISGVVGACTDHITAIAGNIEKNDVIYSLEAGNGAPSSFNPLAIIERIAMGPVERRIATALARRFECWVPTEFLVGYAYAGIASGGPQDAEGGIRPIVYHLKLKLKPHGLTIRGTAHYGRMMVRI